MQESNYNQSGDLNLPMPIEDRKEYEGNMERKLADLGSKIDEMASKAEDFKEKAAEKLLARLRQQPLAKEREEFGMMLMRHIDSFTPEERKRYEELKAILREG